MAGSHVRDGGLFSDALPQASVSGRQLVHRAAHGRSKITASDLRARLGIGSEAEVVLFAGKVVAFKRPTDVVAAVARLKASGRDVCVLVAGAGPLEIRFDTASLREASPAPPSPRGAPHVGAA